MQLNPFEKHLLDLLWECTKALNCVESGELTHREFYNEINRVITWGKDEYPTEDY